MRRLISLLLIAAMAISVGAPVAGAQSMEERVTGTITGTSFLLPPGFEQVPIPALDAPVIEAASLVNLAEERTASVVITQLEADVTGISADDYKAILDAVSIERGEELLSSEIVEVQAPYSPTGQWIAVVQVIGLVQDGMPYERVRLLFPVADREYTFSATAATGNVAASAETVGFLAASLQIP